MSSKISKPFKGLSRNHQTEEDRQAIESFSPESKSTRNIPLSVRVTEDMKAWIEEMQRYLNQNTRRNVTNSDLLFFSIIHLQKLDKEEILRDFKEM